LKGEQHEQQTPQEGKPPMTAGIPGFPVDHPVIALMSAVGKKLPCEYCGTDTTLIEFGRVIGIRHYEDCPKYDPCCRFSAEFGTLK
jgi:hypothetical protein